ncbi:isopropylmalate/homocitrate/citramalate synthase [Synechocystis sp. PCC 7509]|uniref:isopropylmalate/homocitrate/citramalate synthase n=1 Tax=Synechocystis sp. PCC 7509 TaxID=927677 RepID=UPI0002ABFF8A|nr:isopropylmalate/homocitrate/citramalate synthase [Synechocystis sp. PCC 7509]
MLQDKIVIFDTTLRDGELAPGVSMNLQQKTSIATLLEAMGVDVIEVGYPGRYNKDFQEIFSISKIIKNSIICGLASSNSAEIITVAEAIKPANRGRINIFTPVNVNSKLHEQTLAEINASVSFAKTYCEDVEWNAFDATRTETDFLGKAVEVAINSGATTITIPDSLGLAKPEEFLQLLETIFHRVSNIDKAIVAVHCHDDLGMAVDNSIVGLSCGVRQIECSINGLGARKGNADLEKVVKIISQEYRTNVNTSLINQASKLVTQITGITKN